MLIKAFEVGQLSTNCYVVTDEKTLCCAIIDPGAESGRILNYIAENNLKRTATLTTPRPWPPCARSCISPHI